MFQQLLTEALLLAGAGGALGLLLVRAGRSDLNDALKEGGRSGARSGSARAAC